MAKWGTAVGLFATMMAQLASAAHERGSHSLDCEREWSGNPSQAAFAEWQARKTEELLGPLWQLTEDKVRKALEIIRNRHLAGDFHNQGEVLYQWNEFAAVLARSDRGFSTQQLRARSDGTILVWGARKGQCRFLAISADEPPRLYYGSRAEEPNASTAWRDGNESLEEWDRTPANHE